MASVDRALIASPKLRACILSHRANPFFIPPRAAMPSDFEDYTVGALRPSLDIEGRYPIRVIAGVMVELSGWSLSQICSDRRTHGLVHARMITYWLARHHTGLSLPRIGQILGNKDHTSVLSGCRRIERVMLAESIAVTDDLHVMARRLWSSAWARKAA